jgi:hypothetical protein
MKKTVSSDILKGIIQQGERQESIKSNKLATELNMAPDEVLSFLRQIFPVGVGVGIEIYYRTDEYWIDFQNVCSQYHLPLSPNEWIHLYQIIFSKDFNKSPVIQDLRKKITEKGPLKRVTDLLSQLDVWDKEVHDAYKQIRKDLEESIKQSCLLRLRNKSGKSCSIYPWKIIHLEGVLSLVAEDFQEHCLLVIQIRDIELIETLEKKSSPKKVSNFEVEEFISAIRSMSEKETRLILKIHQSEGINLFPEDHFLGKPCMVTNPNGDLIWAAYIEPCESLFEWILNMGKRVEILDPLKFKEEYLVYCEEKIKKIA